MYRRLIAMASCRESGFSYEIGVNEATSHARASTSIPGLVPRVLDRLSYESGQNAGGLTGREWTAPATKVDKTPVMAEDVTREGAEAGIRASDRSIIVLGLRRQQSEALGR